jgi:hypothetical protein
MRFVCAFIAMVLAGSALHAQTSQPAVLNVRDFGAIPDDDKDDSIAIQAAIDAARGKPPQTIVFPSGVFLVSQSLDPRGFGRVFRGTTTIRWDNDRYGAGSQTVLKSVGDGFVFHFVGDGVTFQNLTFDGRGIFCDRSDRSMVRNLVVDNCWFRNQLSGEHNNSIEFTTGLENSRITNCVFDPISGDNGIYGYNWKNLTIANNAFLNGNEGIHVVAHQIASSDLLIEQNYFSGLRRMAVEVQGGGVDTVVQDNYYENPVMSEKFEENMSTFAYSIISDRSRHTRVRRNTSLAPERPDGTGVRIIFELGGEDVVCEDNYSVGGNCVAILNTSRNGKILNNRFVGQKEGPSAFHGRSPGAIVKENGSDTRLSWDVNRGKPGPNKRLPATNPAG